MRRIGGVGAIELHLLERLSVRIRGFARSFRLHAEFRGEFHGVVVDVVTRVKGQSPVCLLEFLRRLRRLGGDLFSLNLLVRRLSGPKQERNPFGVKILRPRPAKFFTE